MDSFTVSAWPDEFLIVDNSDDWVIYTTTDTEYTLVFNAVGLNDVAIVQLAVTEAEAAASAAAQSAVDAATAAASGMQAPMYDPQGIHGDAFARANHTGTESADVLTDGATNKAFLATERTKLAGIAAGATANSADAFLLARANHTGTESADVLTDGATNKAFLATERTKLAGIAVGATVNSTDVFLLARANHTGTESADVLTDGATNKAFLATERTKLAGIAAGATVNSTDAFLLARANHTGTQLASTISDFSTAADARIALIGLPAPVANTFVQRNSGNTAYVAKLPVDVRNALAAAVFVADRAAIKALDPTLEKAATTYGEGRGVNGTFFPVLTSSLSVADAATKALDTTEAVYFTSTQNALYTWVRHYDPAIGISATWFGLKADGVTDDHVAIEKAAAFLGTTGGVVNLPKGTIEASNTNLESIFYVTFRGQGSLSGGGSVGTSWRSQSAVNDAVNCKSSFGLSFERIQFLHSSTMAGKRFFNFSRGTAGTDGVYMSFRGCSFNTISTASASSKFLYLDGSTRGYFEQCSFTGRGAFVFGGDATNIGFSNVHTFVQCSFNPVSEYPILNPGEAWSFIGCTFEANNSAGAGYGRAISTTVGADRVGFRGLTISGCWFGDVTTAGGQWLALTLGEGLTITGCTVGGLATTYFAALGGGNTGVPATSGVRGVSMFGNRFTGCIAFNVTGTQANGDWVQGVNVGGNSSNTTFYTPANMSSFSQLTNSPNRIEGLPADPANFAFTIGQTPGIALTVSKQLVQVQGTKVALSNSVTTAQAIFAAVQDTITVAAATTYRFRARIALNTGATSHTTSFGFGGTATFTTCKYTSITSSSAANTLGTAQTLRVDSAAATVVAAASTAVSTDILLEGTIRVNAGGTIIPQVTFSAGPTGTCETDIDSYFELEEMGSSTLAIIGNAA